METKCVLQMYTREYFHRKFSKIGYIGLKIHWNTLKPRTYVYISTKIYKTLKNSTYQSKSQKIYASMASMAYNVEIPRRDFKDSSQLNNFILDSGAPCHNTREISDFIPGLLVE